MAYDNWRVYPGGYPNIPGSKPQRKLKARGNREIDTGRRRPEPPSAAPGEPTTAQNADTPAAPAETPATPAGS